MFKPLEKTEVSKIVDLLLQKLEDRLAEKQLKLEVTQKAKNYIVENGYDETFGARPLKRFIQSTIETMVARKMLSEDLAPNTTIVVDEQNGEIVVK